MGKHRQQHSDMIRAPQQGEPEAIMSWVRLPDGRIRLYASRRLDDIAWGQRTREKDGSVVWHLDGDLDQVLIVDRATAAEALQWVLERWAREDAEMALEPGQKPRIARPAEIGGARFSQVNTGI